MTDLGALKKGDHRVRIAEDRDWVSSWLRDTEQQNFADDVSTIVHLAPTEPVTPPRRQRLPQRYEEFSPTDTSFSADSVFDTPYPSTGAYLEDPFYDDAPDLVPTDNLDWGLRNKTERFSAETQTLLDCTRSDTDSLASHDPPSEATDNEKDRLEYSGPTAEVAVAPTIDPNLPRFTSITSCTQCIVANLPCSRTVPSCSRCKRNGQGDLCLLHRQQYNFEISRSDMSACTTPKLLRLRGEDEGMLEKKLELAEEVCLRCLVASQHAEIAKLEASWRAVEDRKNWVLPSLDGVAGSFRTGDERTPKCFPGQGKGEMMHRELFVVLEI